jgi:flagellin-like protein
MRGVSPLVATVLLIAFTVMVAGIISIWLSGFTKTSVSTIGSEAEQQIACIHASLSLRDVKYSTSSGSLFGSIENTGVVNIGNISLHVIYANATFQKFELCLVGNQALSCPLSNLTLASRDLVTFNISVASNYDKIILTGNCSTRDEISANDVSLA